MIDPSLILNNFSETSRSLQRRGFPADELAHVLALLENRRRISRLLDPERAKANVASESVGTLLKQGRQADADIIRERVAATRAEISNLEAEHSACEEQIRYHMLRIPNLPAVDAPDGLDESMNVIRGIFQFDEDRFLRGAWRPHWEIGADLGILDGERAAKLSGSMFAFFRRQGAELIRALIRFALDLHKGTYEEILPPHFVRGDIFTGTGHLPKFEMEAYKMRDDDLWAIPTGEVPLMGLHRDEVLAEADLPKRYMASTVCFRREAGSHGKDTRGTQRVHEFHKVELLKLVDPETVKIEFESLLADAVKPLQMFGFPYRIVDLCCGDLTFSSARIWDIEVYAPGVKKWLEVSSVGIFTDFQTRRGNIRFRRNKGKTLFPFALNGSAMATPRMWAAVIEHGQQPDGSVLMPPALVPYLGFDRIPARS